MGQSAGTTSGETPSLGAGNVGQPSPSRPPEAPNGAGTNLAALVGALAALLPLALAQAGSGSPEVQQAVQQAMRAMGAVKVE